MDTIEEKREPMDRKVAGRVVVIIGILALVLLGMWWYKKQDKTVDDTTTGTGAPIIENATESALTPEELRKNFVSSVNTLIQDIPSIEAGTTSELITKVEDRLMTVHVPSEKKETYLNVFLAIENLKKNETDSIESVKTKILELISSLLQST